MVINIRNRRDDPVHLQVISNVRDSAMIRQGSSPAWLIVVERLYNSDGDGPSHYLAGSAPCQIFA